jgi:hypothetical protein
MTRVLRPGGLVSLVDTDWSTFEIDVGDDDLATRVREAMRTERRRPSNIGRRLGDLVQDVGCELKAQDDGHPELECLGSRRVTSARGVLLDVEPRR